MQLQSLQQRLQSIYEIDMDYDVEDFVTSDSDLADRLETAGRPRQIPEKLLVREHADGLDISLFLHRDLLRKLQKDNPTHALHAGNFAEFCTVTEGISHFVYLIWNACRERSISLFELELQAEVDKYVMAAAWLADQQDGTLPHNLPQVLFDQPRFDSQLNRLEQQRYRMANAYARHYCHNLHRNLLELGDSVLITRELRGFYRLLHHRKIQRIATLPKVH
ncbi:MAG: hypothetical protein P8Z75_10690 [Gammaproteobacteria bacterium]